jgi:hypothetical protein
MQSLHTVHCHCAPLQSNLYLFVFPFNLNTAPIRFTAFNSKMQRDRGSGPTVSPSSCDHALLTASSPTVYLDKNKASFVGHWRDHFWLSCFIYLAASNWSFPPLWIARVSLLINKIYNFFKKKKKKTLFLYTHTLLFYFFNFDFFTSFFFSIH